MSYLEGLYRIPVVGEAGSACMTYKKNVDVSESLDSRRPLDVRFLERLARVGLFVWMRFLGPWVTAACTATASQRTRLNSRGVTVPSIPGVAAASLRACFPGSSPQVLLICSKRRPSRLRHLSRPRPSWDSKPQTARVFHSRSCAAAALRFA